MMMMTGRYNIIAGDMHEYFATEKFRRRRRLRGNKRKRSVLRRPPSFMFYFISLALLFNSPTRRDDTECRELLFAAESGESSIKWFHVMFR